nr:retrotransposon protein, putative, Ty1-copia subclass [Tanacetum cinerariifolium]
MYLAKLMKKQKQVGSASSSGIFTIELFAFPNKSWVYDTGCGTHICITKQEFREARKHKQGALYFNGIYEIDMHDLISNVNSIYNVSTKRAKHNLDSTYLWHLRLAHISKKRIEKLQQKGLLKSTDDESFDQCISCLFGKITRKSFPHRPERATDLLGIIHTDVCGPLRHVSRQGASYFITFTDDYSHYGYVYLLKHKHETHSTLPVSSDTPSFRSAANEHATSGSSLTGVSRHRKRTREDVHPVLAPSETLPLKKNTRLYWYKWSETLNVGYSPVYDDLGDCDQRCQYYGVAFWYGKPLSLSAVLEVLEALNGSREALITEHRFWCSGIHDVPIKDALYPTLTPSYTPQHNGVSERRNRTLLEMVRSMMNLTILPLSFRDYALESATQILNMVSTKKGCEALVKRDTPDKLQQRSVKRIFIGYPKETMGYYFYFPPESKIVVARYAKFFEKNLITQKVSRRAIDLEEIQDEDTSPSKITNEIPVVVEGVEPPQGEVIPIRRTAFLNVYLDEDIYMVQPKGFVDPDHPRKVCKLQRSIYGLKQASISWNKRFDEKIKKFGFAQNLDEPCVYQKPSRSNVTFLILYVDDIIIMRNHILSLQSVKDYLVKVFAIKDLGEATFILEIKIYRDRSKRLIRHGQNAYMDKILKRYKMDNSKRGHIPMQERLDLNKTQDASTPKEVKRMQNVPYASAVGSIMYAVRCTRPDVAFA